MLLSFAQFEREVTGERICDKIAASKKKGMWMGGPVPLGYEVKERKLLINEPVAEKVRYIFQRYADLWEEVQQQIDANRINRKSGRNARAPSLLAGVIQRLIKLFEDRHAISSLVPSSDAKTMASVFDRADRAAERLKISTFQRRTMVAALVQRVQIQDDEI